METGVKEMRGGRVASCLGVSAALREGEETVRCRQRGLGREELRSLQLPRSRERVVGGRRWGRRGLRPLRLARGPVGERVLACAPGSACAALTNWNEKDMARREAKQELLERFPLQLYRATDSESCLLSVSCKRHKIFDRMRCSQIYKAEERKRGRTTEVEVDSYAQLREAGEPAVAPCTRNHRLRSRVTGTCHRRA